MITALSYILLSPVCLFLLYIPILIFIYILIAIDFDLPGVRSKLNTGSIAH